MHRTTANHAKSAKPRAKEEADHQKTTAGGQPPETPTADSSFLKEQQSRLMPSNVNSGFANDPESQDSETESNIESSSIFESGRPVTPATSVGSSESSSKIWTEETLQHFPNVNSSFNDPDRYFGNQQHIENPQEKSSTRNNAIDTLESPTKEEAGSTRFEKENFDNIDWVESFYDQTGQKPPGIDAEVISPDILKPLSACDMFNGLFVRCDVLARFRNLRKKCLANTKKGNRCESWVGKADVSAIACLLDEMKGEYESSKSVEMLKQLAKIAICRHHSILAQEQIDLLSADIEIRGHRQAIVREVRRESEDTHSSDTDDVKERGNTFEEHDGARTLDIDAGFESYFTPNTRAMPKHQYMDEILRKSLTDSEEESGYIYLYWNDVNSGMGKIGKTTGDVGKRLGEWERQCKRLVSAHYRSDHSPHIGRIEKLIHADLAELRLRTSKCQACSQVHQEWFKIDEPEKVKEIIIKWTTWMQREPYEKKDGKWQLKAEFERNVGEMRNEWRDESQERSQSSHGTHSCNLRPRITNHGSTGSSHSAVAGSAEDRTGSSDNEIPKVKDTTEKEEKKKTKGRGRK